MITYTHCGLCLSDAAAQWPDGLSSAVEASVVGAAVVVGASVQQRGIVYKVKKNEEIREAGFPNNRISVFTICLAYFVYWVGFVTGISFTLHL